MARRTCCPKAHVQMNVRVPQSMVAAVDERREKLDLSRDEWVRRAITWALLQPPGTRVQEQPARNGTAR